MPASLANVFFLTKLEGLSPLQHLFKREFRKFTRKKERNKTGIETFQIPPTTRAKRCVTCHLAAQPPGPLIRRHCSPTESTSVLRVCGDHLPVIPCHLHPNSRLLHHEHLVQPLLRVQRPAQQRHACRYPLPHRVPPAVGDERARRPVCRSTSTCGAHDLATSPQALVLSKNPSGRSSRRSGSGG